MFVDCSIFVVCYAGQSNGLAVCEVSFFVMFGEAFLGSFWVLLKKTFLDCFGEVF